MSEIVAPPKYGKQAKRLLSVEERESMEAGIAASPLSHPVHVGDAAAAYVSGDTVFLTFLYAKNELESLSHAQENELKRIAQAIEARR